MVTVVIGCNYGDEGKGLVVDYLSSLSNSALVIRHNGGSQSGHTVDFHEKRFIFHGLSSGSFRHADTLWADTFMPDLYKIREEAENFFAAAGFIPKIYYEKNTKITLIDDILINMALESSRGTQRHGSCGMGINEADIRIKSGFGLTLTELSGMNASTLYARLKEIRKYHSHSRLNELNLSLNSAGEYGEMLNSDIVLLNFSEEVLNSLSLLTPADNTTDLLKNYDDIIFENGQGLRLDSEFYAGYPHVTASRTGLTNPVEFIKKHKLKNVNVIYVTRSYLTRHGAGPLLHECTPGELGLESHFDRTNVYNNWQGNIRYSPIESLSDFIAPVCEDLKNTDTAVSTGLFITHLNETDGKIKMASGDIPVEEFTIDNSIGRIFNRFGFSYSPYSEDITEIKT